MIRCRTLGAVAVDLDGEPPPPELLWRKHLALLVYLARSPRRTRTREHLVGLLWPDKEDRAARHSLNEALRVLRRAVGGAAVETSAGQVRLAAGDPWLDVHELEAHIAARDWRGAAGLAGGEFMEGFALPDASGFEDWLAAERTHWRDRSVSALLACADEMERSGQARDAVAPAEQALRLDPTSDRAMRSVLRARALAGDRGVALARYADFLEQLRRAGLPPHADTERYAERIRRQRERFAAPSAAREAATTRRAPLVGRAVQLAGLLDVLAASASGARALVAVIDGEAGTGKSRLVEEVASRARLDGAVVASVRAVPADRLEPHGGLIALARGGVLDAAGLPSASPSALAAFAREIPEWSDRFPAARTAEPAPPVPAFVEVLRACGGEQPVVLAVDDAHHLDDASALALVRALRDLSTSPLTVLFSMLPRSAGVPLEELRARLGRDVTGAVVHLKPLDTDALEALVRWALPAYDAEAAGRLARRLASDSAGLPLLSIELLHAVAQGLDLGTVAGAWPNPLRTLSETLPGDLPDAVRAAVRVGFRRLTDTAQRVLAAHAVLEDRVESKRLARATELPLATVHEALDELEWARWIGTDPRGYGFVARIVREVVAMDMTTPGQRQRIRDRAGPLGA